MTRRPKPRAAPATAARRPARNRPQRPLLAFLPHCCWSRRCSNRRCSPPSTPTPRVRWRWPRFGECSAGRGQWSLPIVAVAERAGEHPAAHMASSPRCNSSSLWTTIRCCRSSTRPGQTPLHIERKLREQFGVRGPSRALPVSAADGRCSTRCAGARSRTPARPARRRPDRFARRSVRRSRRSRPAGRCQSGPWRVRLGQDVLRPVARRARQQANSPPPRQISRTRRRCTGWRPSTDASPSDWPPPPSAHALRRWWMPGSCWRTTRSPPTGLIPVTGRRSTRRWTRCWPSGGRRSADRADLRRRAARLAAAPAPATPPAPTPLAGWRPAARLSCRPPACWHPRRS